jgi:hypothetical protein
MSATEAGATGFFVHCLPLALKVGAAKTAYRNEYTQQAVHAAATYPNQALAAVGAIACSHAVCA